MLLAEYEAGYVHLTVLVYTKMQHHKVWQVRHAHQSLVYLRCRQSVLAGTCLDC